MRETSGQVSPWCAGAAYLYVLHIGAAALAWEYLRRNADYRASLQANTADHDSLLVRWGLAGPEDPHLDARDAQPLWRPRPRDEPRIIPVDEDRATLRFDVWAIPGQKLLCHDGRRLILECAHRGERISIAVDLELEHDMAFGYVVAARSASAWRAARRVDGMITSGDELTVPALATAASRNAIAHMHTLQAFDGARAGASQREVARCLFGVERVSLEWTPDSELRARTRHYFSRGRAFVHGGYRRLVQATEPNRNR